MDKIVIKGAREHNLKNIDVELPRDKLVVITGLSGSGKSSLAFDTIYAEGQRRYVESLSTYARQFSRADGQADLDSIEGLSPAISIEQKSTSKNPRSTVGTITEIYDYLRLLYARIGTVHCHSCNLPIAAQTVQQMVDRVLKLPQGTRFSVLAPIVRGRKGEWKKELDGLRRQGLRRVSVDGELFDLSEDTIKLDKNKAHTIEVYVDRLVVKGDVRQRLTEAIELSLSAGRRNRQGLAGPARRRSSCPKASASPTKRATSSFPSALPASTAASATPRSRRACSASTIPRARVRPATASAPRCSSTPS
jgi:excinuclease ABC subunit A